MALMRAKVVALADDGRPYVKIPAVSAALVLGPYMTTAVPAPAVGDTVLVADLAGGSRVIIANERPVAGAMLPVGGGVEYYADVAPDGYVMARGQLELIASYPRLAALFGTKYGGDGITTFGIPDRRKRVAVGLDAGDTDFAKLGQTGGEKDHVLTTDEMPSHAHVQNPHSHTTAAHVHATGSHAHTSAAHVHTLNHDHGSVTSSANGGHNHAISQVLATNADQGTTDTNDSGASSLAAGRESGRYQRAVGMTTSTSSVHQHTVDLPNHTGNTGSTTPGSTGATDPGNTASATVTVNAATATNQTTGGGKPHNNMPPYLVVNYIIKT